VGNLNGFHHRCVVLCDFLGCLHSFCLKGQSCIQIFLTIHLDGVCSICGLLSYCFVFSDCLCDDFSRTSFFLDLSSFDFYFFRSLNKHRLFGFQFGLHNTDRALRLDKTVITVCIPISKGFNFLSLLFKQDLESRDELKIRCRCNVVSPLQLLFELPS